MAVRARGVLPGCLHRAASAEDRLDHVRGARPGLGDDRRGARLDEPGRVVVDPLVGLVERAFGEARLGVAARVAQVVQQDDGVLRQLDLRRDVRLAEVLMGGVVATGRRIEPEAVLGRREEVVPIAARPAVAVAHVDDERGPRDRLLDGRPRRIGRIELDDVGRVMPRDGRGGACLCAVAIGRVARRPDDEDDLGDCLGRRCRSEGGRRTQADGEQGREDGSADTSHDEGHTPCGEEKGTPEYSFAPYQFRITGPLSERYGASAHRLPYHRDHAQPPRRGNESVPPPARAQPRRLVSVGPRCARGGEAARPTDLPVDRLRGLSLVSRDGTRVVRERADRPLPERSLRRDQGRSRGAARSRPGVHGGGPVDDRGWRLADVGLPDPGRPAVLRRDLFPGRASPRDARRSGRSSKASSAPGASSVPRSRRRVAGSSRRWSNRAGSMPARTIRRRRSSTVRQPGSKRPSTRRTAAGAEPRSSRSR